MTTLTATAIITAVDRASAVFARVAGAAQAAAGRFDGVAQQAKAVDKQIGAGFGIATAAGIGLLLAKTQQFQETLAGIEIAGISENLDKGAIDFEKLRAQAQATKEEALRLSEALKMPPLGFVQAGEAALKMGLSADRVAKLMEMSGSVHVQDRQITQGRATEFLGTMGILFGAGKDGRDYATDLEKLTNQWLGVANMTRTTAARIEEGLRQFAPLYASFGEDFGSTASLVGAMVQAGLMDVESGTALKSLGVRMLRPTREGREAMLAAGINRAEFMDLEPVDAGKAFRSLMSITPVRVAKGDQDVLRAMLNEASQKKLFLNEEWQQEFLRVYNEMTGAGDAESQHANTERLMMSLLTGGGRIQMSKLIERLASMMDKGELTNAQMAAIGEGRHLSRYKALFKMIEEYRKLQKMTQDVTDSFTKGGNQIWSESNAGKWSGALAAVDRGLQRLRDSSGILFVIESFETLANKLAGLSPEFWSFAGKVAAAAAGLAAFGLAAKGIGAGLGLIAAGLANPLTRALLIGGGLALGAGGIAGMPEAAARLGTEMAASLGHIADLAGQAYTAIRSLFTAEDLQGSALVELVGMITAAFEKLNQALAIWKKEGLAAAVDKMAPAQVPADRANYETNMEEGRRWLRGQFPWLAEKLWGSAAEQEAGYQGRLRDIPGATGPVEVQGKGEVQGQMDIRLQLDVPPGFSVQETGRSGGQINGTMDLNTGRSMPDTQGYP